MSVLSRWIGAMGVLAVGAMGVLAIGALGASTGCGPQPPAGCPRPEGTDAGAATRVYALALGSSDFPDVTPWTDGQTVRLEHGAQGGYMVRPTLDIDTGDYPDSNCFHVAVENTVADGTVLTQYDAYSNPEPDPRPHFFRIELFDLLSFDGADVDGKALTLHVRVTGRNGNGETTVTVTPRTSP